MDLNVLIMGYIHITQQQHTKFVVYKCVEIIHQSAGNDSTLFHETFDPTVFWTPLHFIHWLISDRAHPHNPPGGMSFIGVQQFYLIVH